MRSIEYARTKGRETRQALNAPGTSLLTSLEAHLKTDRGVKLISVSRDQMGGSRGEIDAETSVLKYDASLGDEKRLMLFAHELGHLVLHQRLRQADDDVDPVFASAYGETGVSAIARYNPRTHEETQANAFALELVAPSDDVWTVWRDNAGMTMASLAARFRCGVDVIGAQLAHALHAHALGGIVPSASRKDVPFTHAQLAAARFTGAPAIVDAGPGTGKTATVIRRIQYLLKERGARPGEILALTFSNEAAQELSERVATMFGDDVADAVNVRTFHGFGVEFLHLHGHLNEIDERLELLDDDRQIELVTRLLGSVPCDDIIDLRVPLETAARVVDHINYCKQRLYGADLLGDTQFAGLFRAYEGEKTRAEPRLVHGDDVAKHPERRGYPVDFADLIALPIRILEGDKNLRDAYAKRFPWVIVDEFQDVTRATSRLLRALCGPDNPPWVVGDGRQSIYQFLGAAPENVTAFGQDFPGASVFALDVNYRSSAPVVAAANQLASLLENAEGPVGDLPPRWTAGTATAPLGEPAVTIAEAASQAAESKGIAARVNDWIECDGVTPGDIAVLCRRHVDVRNVILELSRRGIKAQASGVLTAEGAAGDLAAMLTLADAPAASIPRVAFALGRGRWSAGRINATIGHLLRELRNGDDAATEQRDSDPLANEVKQLYRMLNPLRDGADAFATLAAVLFDDGVYLRRILALSDSAERQTALVEIVSVLSLATAYRATHRDMTPREARIGFAERLRVRLTRTLPVPLAPRPRVDAVHVMTCHASKGLEFPCVAVVGQTLPGIDDKLVWLPPALRPDRSREEAQANALLFVGVTRAKRSVLVSFPARASAGARRGGNAVVPLLARWRETFGVPTVQWTDEAASESGTRAGNVWGLPLQTNVKASALDDSVCPLLTYVETYAGARFPEAHRELYPSWVHAVRRTLRAIVARSYDNSHPASDDDARAILDDLWPAQRTADHYHGGLYREMASRVVVSFARAFRPMAALGVVELESEIVLPFADGLEVRLDLIARYRQNDGSAVAIAFRPESLADDECSLKWSDLAESKRSSLALLESLRPGMKAYVFSGRDGRIYEYKWSRIKKSLPTLTAKLEARRVAFVSEEFGADVSRYRCDGCRVRASCPGWIGALEG